MYRLLLQAVSGVVTYCRRSSGNAVNAVGITPSGITNSASTVSHTQLFDAAYTILVLGAKVVSKSMSRRQPLPAMTQFAALAYVQPIAINPSLFSGWISSANKSDVDTPPSEEIQTELFPTKEQIEAVINYCATGDINALKQIGVKTLRKIVRHILRDPQSPIDALPLHIAVSFNQLEVLRYLLKHKIMPVDATLRSTPITALHHAIVKGNTEAALILLYYGASVHHETPEGLNLLQLAWRYGLYEIVACIRKIIARESEDENFETESNGIRDYVSLNAEDYTTPPESISKWDFKRYTYRPRQFVDLLNRENPLPVPIIDVSPITMGLKLDHPASALVLFQEGRSNDGSELHGVELDCKVPVPPWIQKRLVYELPPHIRWWPSKSYKGPIYKAKDIDDRWDVYRNDDELLFVDSETQCLLYRVRFAVTKLRPLEDQALFASQYSTGEGTEAVSGFQVVEIESAVLPRPKNWSVMHVDFLIKKLVLDMEVPAPLLPIEIENSNDKETIAKFLLTEYGRIATFAVTAQNYEKLFGNRINLAPSRKRAKHF